MDLNGIIETLHQERNRLDQVIRSLELAVSPSRETHGPGRKRGRKSMDQEAREAVADRMKRYWARRRAMGAGGESSQSGFSSQV